MAPVSRSRLSLLSHRLLLPLLVTMTAPAAAATLSAQDSTVTRALSLARSGDSAKARLALDSLLATNPAATTRDAATYWRAELSASPAEKEKSLTLFVIDSPFSPYVGEAYFSLGMLELANNDRERAGTHLTQFLALSPNDSNRATASLTLARILFDLGESGRGCAVALNGRAELPETAVELRNKFDFLATPCSGVDTSSTPRPKPDSTAAAPDTTPRSSLGEYTVQVAAYDLKAQADRLATRLRGAGYEARVIGTKKPFRVRVGHYDTHAAADAASKKIEALVKLKPFVLLLGPEDM